MNSPNSAANPASVCRGFAELHAYLEKYTVQRLVSELNKLPETTTCGSIRQV